MSRLQYFLSYKFVIIFIFISITLLIFTTKMILILSPFWLILIFYIWIQCLL